MEGSPALRQKLRETLSEPMASQKVTLASEEPSPAIGNEVRRPANSGFTLARACGPEVPLIIFANEFFDALPVEVLSSQGTLHIGVRDGGLFETWQPTSDDEQEFLDRYAVSPETGERVETGLRAQHYLTGAVRSLQHGFLVIIDYGYTRDEQLQGRHRGTVMAYRRHSVSANPYQAPGEQDITAHVNFTALASTARKEGLQVQKLLTQSQFLMGIGEASQFADAFEECRLPQERAKVALQLKHLVTPAGMGESFHVMLASKGVEAKRAESLSGLSFAGSRI